MKNLFFKKEKRELNSFILEKKSESPQRDAETAVASSFCKYSFNSCHMLNVPTYFVCPFSV